MHTTQGLFSDGACRSALPIGRRLGLFAMPLGLPGLALLGNLTWWAGPAGTNAAPDPTREPAGCPKRGLNEAWEWAGLHHDELDPQRIDLGEAPLRFDCGSGESWRRHVP